MPADRKDVYDEINQALIAKMDAGVVPWRQPWEAGNTEGRIVRPLRFSGEKYQGINVLMLWSAAMEKGFSNPVWLTFKQAADAGGQVRKGERSSPVVYADKIKRRNKETGEDEEVYFLKRYNVFNVDQVDGLPAHYHAVADLPKLTPMERNAKAEAFIKNTGAEVHHGGTRAYYTAEHDRIQMPPFEAFKDPESYHTTLLHEATHWTKHPTRLDRDFGRKKFGDEGYSKEEIVAELAAAYLAADLGLELAPRDEHAAYLDNWLKAMKADKRFIFQAASHASKAADYLHGLQPKLEAAVEAEEPEAATVEPPALPQADAPPASHVERETRRRAVKGQGRLL